MKHLNRLFLVGSFVATGLLVLPASADDITFTFDEHASHYTSPDAGDQFVAGFLLLCSAVDSPNTGACNGAFSGYYISDLVYFSGVGTSNVDYLSDGFVVGDPNEDPADLLNPTQQNCSTAVCLAEISLNGVERIDYTPLAGQPGYNANPGDGDVFHFVIYSDTPEPGSLLLLGTVLMGVIRTMKHKFV